MTITPELLAEIRAKAEVLPPVEWSARDYALGNGRSEWCVTAPKGGVILFDDGTSDEGDPEFTGIGDTDHSRLVVEHAARMDPPTTLSLISALEEAQRERDDIRAENDKFRARLEIDYCYDGNGMRRELSHKEGDALPDGIECRDATISGLEGRIAELRAENERLREVAAYVGMIAEVAVHNKSRADLRDAFASALSEINAALKETTHAQEG